MTVGEEYMWVADRFAYPHLVVIQDAEPDSQGYVRVRCYDNDGTIYATWADAKELMKVSIDISQKGDSMHVIKPEANEAARKSEFAPGDLVEYRSVCLGTWRGVVSNVHARDIDGELVTDIDIVTNGKKVTLTNVDFHHLAHIDDLKKDDPVSHPSHYTNGSIECIDAMEAAFGRREVIIFSKLNAFKYIWRAELKNNELQDLEKASWYLNKAIELLKEEAEGGMEEKDIQQCDRCNCDHG